jgi:hypothetical protein
VLSALILGSTTPAEVRTATGLDARTVHREVERLVSSGVVSRDEAGGLAVRIDEVADAARALARSLAAAPSATAEPPATAEEKVRRAFLKDGRLVSIPTQRAKRLVVLDVLAQEFEPGHRYPEREVNRRLRRWHDDVATLRRYLVDEGFMLRDRGEYWRAGGSFNLS